MCRCNKSRAFNTLEDSLFNTSGVTTPSRILCTFLSVCVTKIVARKFAASSALSMCAGGASGSVCSHQSMHSVGGSFHMFSSNSARKIFTVYLALLSSSNRILRSASVHVSNNGLHGKTTFPKHDLSPAAVAPVCSTAGGSWTRAACDTAVLHHAAAARSG